MSPLTRYLCRLLGLFLLVFAVAEWTQPSLLPTTAPALIDQPGELLISGMLTLAAGLAIVVGHNRWTSAPEVVVTLLGWLMTLKGAALLLIPASAWDAMLQTLHYPSHALAYTVVPAAAGLYLTYSGFRRSA